jgi:hypothetical protein
LKNNQSLRHRQIEKKHSLQSCHSVRQWPEYEGNLPIVIVSADERRSSNEPHLVCFSEFQEENEESKVSEVL